MHKKLLAAALALYGPLAFANATICQGKLNSCTVLDTSDAEKVFFLTDDTELGGLGDPIPDGTTQYGQTQDTGRIVEFTSSEDLMTFGPGFAQLRAVDGGFQDLGFQMQDAGLGVELIEFSVNSNNEDPNTIAISVLDDNGDTTSQNFLLGNGETWFSIFANPDIPIEVDLLTTGDVELVSFKHLMINPDLVPDGPVVTADAPSNLALLSLGLIGLYYGRRKTHV